MATTYTLPGVLLSGTHASRPAANSVASGALYAETDTGQTYQSNGTSWSAWGQAAGGSGLTGGTPGLTLGTTNAAGSASTGIRTDATIAVFDTTPPVTQALGDAAATGSAAFAARRDHVHGMPQIGPSSSWTPALTAVTTNPTLGSGSAVSGQYTRVGKLVWGWGSIAFGSSGAAAGTGQYLLSVPVTALNANQPVMGAAVLNDADGPFALGAVYTSDTTHFRIAIASSSLVAASNAPWVWAASDGIFWTFTYEAA